jgi:hypothetical protein
VSVPHSGLLHRLDALNVYESLRRRRPHWPPLEAATESGGHEHRHFRVSELEALLRPHFGVDRVARTGLGLQELLHLALLLLRVPLRAERVTRALLPLHSWSTCWTISFRSAASATTSPCGRALVHAGATC